MSHPVYTNDQIVNQIDNGGYWYDSNFQVASSITYGITTNIDWYNAGYGEYAGWSSFNAKQAASALTAIELWDDVIAADLVASADPNAADIRFSNSSTGVSYAHAYYPGQTNADTFSNQKSQGSIWLNNNYSDLNDPDVGEYGFMTIAHEIGHSLGLSHPGSYNGGSPSYQNDAEFEQDTHMYSIMSYFDASNTGADWYASDGKKYYAQTPMVYDVLTAQSIYGADYATRSGDTTYGFNSTEAGSVFDFTFNLHPVITIWDGAGTDTLDLSGWNTDSTISLVPGSYSNADQMALNIAIAYGADIENAIGGAGNDTIIGNDLDNTLIGNGGNDILDGGAGDDIFYAEYTDTIIGGLGRDILYQVNSYSMNIDLGATSIEWMQGGFNGDTIDGTTQTVGVEVYSGGGDDVVTGSDFADFLFVGVGDDTVNGRGGNDVIFGDLGADSLSGGAGNDRIFVDSTDTLYDGGADYDALYIEDSLGMTIDMAATSFEWLRGSTVGGDTITAAGQTQGVDVYASGGNDSISGSSFGDFLWGEAGNDIITGNDGGDVLVGGSGSDRLTGGAGFDVLFANSGGGADGAVDTFVMTAGWGTDILFDFEDGTDLIDMTALGIGFGDLTFTANGAHAQVSYDGNLISVANSAGLIDAGDFLF